MSEMNETSETSDVEYIALRAAKNSDERMIAALNSHNNDDDLLEDVQGNLVVTGLNLEGERIYLGQVSSSVLAMKSVNPLAIIDKVRFVCV